MHSKAMRTMSRPRMENRPARVSRNRRRGALTVELALTIGLAFFFFFAAFEFCRVSMIRHTVDNAVYEGARAGIIPGATATEVENEARRILRTLNLSNVDVDVTPATLPTLRRRSRWQCPFRSNKICMRPPGSSGNVDQQPIDDASRTELVKVFGDRWLVIEFLPLHRLIHRLDAHNQLPILEQAHGSARLTHHDGDGLRLLRDGSSRPMTRA